MSLSFFARRKILKKTNALDLIPIRRCEHRAEEDGTVTILVPKFRNEKVSNFMLGKRSRFISIHLDENGTAVWLEIDGIKDVRTICGNIKTHLGEEFPQVEHRTSKFMSRLYPGLGYAYQRKFEAPFVIANGKAHTDEAALSGKLLSVSAHGDYNFDTHLDFRVSFHPLEEGMVAEAVRVLTSPASWLFEFHLGGTATNPKWEIINLPKELWSFF